MKTCGWVMGLLLVSLSWLPSAARADTIDVKELEKSIDRLLKAYNDADHEKFWAEYGAAANDLKTKQNFDTFRQSIYKNYGKFIRRGDLIKDKSTLEGDNGLVVYQAEFEKEKKVKIAVTWIKEGKATKIAQVEVGQLED